MEKITITFPDGASREYQNGTTFREIAQSISNNLAKKKVAVRTEGKLRDMTASPQMDTDVEFVGFDDDQGKEVFWHSASHLLAQAVTRLFPNAQYAIGPAIENGFYYDFDCDTVFSEETLASIEEEMQKIAAEKLHVFREELTHAEAVDLFEKKSNQYKVEILQDLADSETITVYRQGDFVDLCRGPHVPDTGYIKAFKLTALAGAY